MIVITYRAKQRLRRIAVAALVILLILAAICACWVLWVRRYIVYTRDSGAVLDFTLGQIPQGEKASDTPQETVSLYYNEGANALKSGAELGRITGYYADIEAIAGDIAAVRKSIQALPSDAAVMLDVKDIYGGFCYSSTVASYRASDVDIKAMDELLKQLKNGSRYLIARVSALRDRNYGLEHDSNGVLHKSQGYLWMDDDGCYWLSPAKEGTITYLSQIAAELKQMGFDEVVFSYFNYPDTENTYVPEDKTETLTNAAKTLAISCATDRFAVSFASDAAIALPEGRCRLYLEDVDAMGIASALEKTGIDEPTVHAVFLTDLHDTRFDEYSVLRPLDSAE